MSKSQKTVSDEVKEKIKTKLQELLNSPPPVKDGKIDVLREHRLEIEELIDKGYRLVDIYDSLNGIGFDITSTTFKTYWNRLKEADKTTRRKQPITKKTQTEVSKPKAVKQKNESVNKVESSQAVNKKEDVSNTRTVQLKVESVNKVAPPHKGKGHEEVTSPFRADDLEKL